MGGTPEIGDEFDQASGQEDDPLAAEVVPSEAQTNDPSSLRDEFLLSVAVAENAVAQVAHNLDKLIKNAQRFAPSETVDQEELVGDTETALRLGVTLKTKGERLRCLTLQRGRALSWRTAKHGYLGFKRHDIDVTGPYSGLN